MSQCSKKLYGHLLHDDTTLASTTKNFEFQVLRPEALEKSFKKGQSEKDISRKLSSFTSCHIKRLDKHIPSMKPDIDIETHVSSHVHKKVRDLTPMEIDHIIRKATPRLEHSNNNISFPNETRKGKTDNDLISHDLDLLTKSVECNLVAVDNLIMDLREKKRKQMIYADVIFKEYRVPCPQWAEIIEKSQTGLILTHEIKKPVLYKNPFAEMLRKCDRKNSQRKNSQQFDSNESDHHFKIIEDSESDYEAIYKQYCVEPSESTMDEAQSSPKYMELNKPLPGMNINFLQNNAKTRNPFADFVEEIGDVEIEGNKEQCMKIIIQNKNAQDDQQTKSTVSGKEITKAPKAKLPIKSPKPWSNAKINSNKSSPRPKSERISDSPRPVVVYSARPPASNSKNSSKSKTSHTTCNESVPPRPKPLSRYFSGRQKEGKSIEDLKAEKALIFTKMSNTQERIIELLDKIRVALLEVYIPNSTYEKNKRQKNAMEFSVRFSRNFLYPLKGMIDDLRLTNSDTLNSATSNEATQRVSAIYNLLLQSLSTYHKQLRFFLLDQVPHKLKYVLDMINSTTQMCLQKDLFDRNDAIISCLQDRCNKFLEFLKDLQGKQPSKKTARENHHNHGHDHNQKAKSSITGKSPKNYDLKMFMNDLNMYEPKLVPKTAQRKNLRKLRGNTEKSNSLKPIHVHSEELLSLHMDNVSTHIMHTNADFGNGGKNSSELFLGEQVMQVDQNDVEARKLLMAEMFHEALNKATKKQVCQVLEPIIQTLTTSIDNRKNTENSETAEAIIKAFTTRILNEAQNSKRSEVPHNHKHKVCKVVGTGHLRKGNPTRRRVNHSTSRASKARKPTKLLRQQKANAETIATNKTATAASAVDTAAKAATNIYFDDDNKHYCNNNDNDDCEYENDNDHNINLNIGNSSSNSSSSSCSDAELGDSEEKSSPGKLSNSRSSAGNDIHYRHHTGDNDVGSSSHGAFVATTNLSDFFKKIKNQQMEELRHSSYDEAANTDAVNVSQNATDADNYLSDNSHNSCEIQEQDEEARELFWSTIEQVHSQDELMLSIPNSSTISSPQSSLMDLQQLQQQQQFVSHKLKKEKDNDKNNCKEQKALKQKEVKNVRKNRLYSNKKNWDPLTTPPPAPGVTPSNSARSQKRVEQMEIMRRELQQIYKFPQKQTHATNNDDITLATAITTNSNIMESTLKSMSPETSTRAAAATTTSAAQHPHRMTSDANMLMMNSIEIPLTKKFEMNDTATNANDYFIKKTERKKKKKTNSGRQNTKINNNLERLNTMAKGVLSCARKIDSEYQAQQFENQNNNCTKNKNKHTKLNVTNSPYEAIQLISRCLHELPKVHEDEILQKFVEKERELYKVFEASNLKKCMPDSNEMAEKIAVFEKHAEKAKKHAKHKVERDVIKATDKNDMDNLMQERNRFLEICGKNRFYSNPAFEQPWNIFARIANEITQEIVDSVEDDFTFGLSKFVQDFLELETQL